MRRVTLRIILTALVLCTAQFVPTAAFVDGEYEWENLAEPGKGCFPENCREGQFPMAVVPIKAFGEKLYGVGDKSVWVSEDGIDWKSQPNTDWGERYGMRFAFFDNKLWMLGGMTTWDDFRNDVWNSSDGKDWKQVVPKAAWPARRGHGAVVFKDKLWILGGSLSSGRRNQTPTRFLNDIWSSSDGLNWTQITANAPWSAREVSTSLVFDNKIFVIGGGERGKNRDVWSSGDGRTWTQITAKAEWSERHGSGGLVFDGKIWIFGGVELNDVWYSSNGKHWQMVFANAPWSKRSAVYSTVFNNRLLIFSGKTGPDDSWSGDIWAMNRKSPAGSQKAVE